MEPINCRALLEPISCRDLRLKIRVTIYEEITVVCTFSKNGTIRLPEAIGSNKLPERRLEAITCRKFTIIGQFLTSGFG
jgi:hypothetical protein